MSGKLRKAKRIAKKLDAEERIRQMQLTIDQLRAYVKELERWHREIDEPDGHVHASDDMSGGAAESAWRRLYRTNPLYAAL